MDLIYPQMFSHDLLPSYQPTFNRSVEKAISRVHILVTVDYKTVYLLLNCTLQILSSFILALENCECSLILIKLSKR